LNRDDRLLPVASTDSRWVTRRPPKIRQPTVHKSSLYLHQDGDSTNEEWSAYCQLDSPTWFTWLETATTFRFHTTKTLPVAHGHSRPALPISLRKEQRRRGFFWYAYLRKGGHLLKRYAGRSATLAGARLDEVALDLNFG
jgi:hypothetical protein